MSKFKASLGDFLSGRLNLKLTRKRTKLMIMICDANEEFKSCFKCDHLRKL